MMSHGFGPMIAFIMVGNVFIFSGIVLLLAWAIKHIHGDKLRQVAVWLIAAGVVLWIIFGIICMSMGGMKKHMMRGGGDDVRWMMDMK